MFSLSVSHSVFCFSIWEIKETNHKEEKMNFSAYLFSINVAKGERKMYMMKSPPRYRQCAVKGKAWILEQTLLFFHILDAC